MFYVINFRKFYKIFITIIILIFLLFFTVKIIKNTFPIKYEDIIEKYSAEYSVDKYLIYAVINAESNFEEGAISSKGASGLMQLMEETAIWLAENNQMDDFNFEEDIFVPDINIKLGTMYLAQLINKYDDELVALAAYNAGTGNVNKWLENTDYSKDNKTLYNIPFKETKNYVKKIKFFKKVYQIIFKIRDIF